MAAAVAAYEAGLRDILILERDSALGGILRQCIHNGFGLHRFGEELTGPEYAYRYEKQVRELEIPFMLDTMVIDIDKNKTVTAMNKEHGIFLIDAKAIILAMGCRERPKGALNIAGHRPAGIYTAGTAQKFVNMKGYMPGRECVILGSGDIGLIMARRMTLEGASVKAVCELMPYSGGLARNIEQCLNDFNIPLKLSHTVIDIHGKERLEGVTIARVDENRRPIPETAEYIPCDTLLLSCGLIPENELTKGAGIELDRITGGAAVDGNRETEIEGIFACGNVLHVHDLVDYVSEESVIAGRAAVDYINGRTEKSILVNISTDGRVRYTVPQRLTEIKDTEIYFRVSDVFRDKKIVVRDGERVILEKKKQKLAPGEMETVKLTAEMIGGIVGGEIKVSLEEVK
ncbi:MAG: FAD-dependent oxidoreductase [Clostridia bacterium]|nr:FAD-dependent oxidoreductase [Clostridia bacterium]MBR2964925.1 FAD-dependent oxidoreductase [Clostridia bacterium]